VRTRELSVCRSLTFVSQGGLTKLKPDENNGEYAEYVKTLWVYHILHGSHLFEKASRTLTGTRDWNMGFTSTPL
jgi:hypothetical protein